MKLRNILKKIGICTLIGCITVGTIGCSGGSEDNSDKSTLNEGEKRKVTFWAPFDGGDGDTMTALVDKFNEQSEDIEVEFMIIKSAEYYTKLFAAMTSDTAPTVAISHISRIKEFVTDDLIEPLDDLTANAEIDWDDFMDNLNEASKIEGTRYCMPIDTHFLLMHHNLDMYKELGIIEEGETLEIPAGEEGFFEFYEKVRDGMPKGKMAISGTSSNGLPMYLWYSLLTQYGGDICNEDGTEATLNTEENIKALSTMMKMVDEDIWPKNQKNGGELFTGKIAASTINGDWALPIFKESEGLNFVSLPVPQVGEKPSAYADSHTLIIPKNNNLEDEDREAAIEFMKWLTDNMAEWATVGHIPSKKSVVESEEFKAIPHVEEYVSAVDSAKFFPQVCGIAGLTELAQRELTTMVAGEQDIETTANNMQEEFQKILDSYK